VVRFRGGVESVELVDPAARTWAAEGCTLVQELPGERRDWAVFA
jgi:hypothetical protein